ncbi:lymphocyte cytosolic protein 2-like isoform X1 [Onthophagus taurus]|uniref:lymphocyte cytosolic protein 2-like isoform X1 n=2 Tax=Onthophagus taurus TaxID=166361 RepID=UPI0039BE96BC
MNHFINELRSFNNDELINFLKKNGFDDFCDIIAAKVYDGNKLLNLTEFEMQLWIPRKTAQERKNFLNFLTDLKLHPDKYFEQENDEIYENHAEERHNKAEIFKKNVEKLIEDDAIIDKFKTALKQKEKDIVSSDSFDSEDDDQIYRNEPSPKMPPKPSIMPKPKLPKEALIKSPIKIKKSSIPMNVFNELEKCLQKDRKSVEIVGKKDDNTQLNVPTTTKTLKPLPILPINDVEEIKMVNKEDEDEELPEYLDIDEEKAREDEDKDVVKEMDVSMTQIKQRPLPPLPPPSPTKKIQKVPLPPVPNNQNTLPRPPKMLVDFGSINKIPIDDVEDFNFEQSFVSKYSKAEFYRYTDRKGSERLLQQPNIKNGTFLVRPSDNHYCTISVKYNERIYQLALHKGKGTKVIQADVEYNSLEDYLDYYKKEALCLPHKTEGFVNVYLTGALPPQFT